MEQKKEKIIGHVSALITFMAAVLIMTLPFKNTGRIYTISDWLFHASRVEEIYRNISQGEWFTFISTTTLQSTGGGSFLFYPTLFLYPWAFFRTLMTPVSAFYAWYGMMTLMSFIISYFCMWIYSKNILRSVLFSFIYVLIPYKLYLGGFVFGEFIASIFLPIVFLGLYEITEGKIKNWVYLPIGVSLVVYSHVLSVFIIIEIMAVWLLVKIVFGKGISFDRVMMLFISGLISIFLSLPTIIPFFTDFIGKNIHSVFAGINVTDAGTIIQSSLSNTASATSVGILMLITVFFGWKWFSEDSPEKKAYIIGVFLLIFATSIFPWQLYKHNWLGVVQMPWRYLIFSGFFLAVVCSKKLSELFKLNWIVKFKRFSTPVACLSILVIGMYSYWGSSIEKYQSIKKKNNIVYLQKNLGALQNTPQPAQVDNKNYQAQFSKYTAIYGETDYYPRKAQKEASSIINHIAYAGKKKIIVNPVGKPNELDYQLNIKKSTNIDLPVLAYTNTYVKVNGELVKFVKSDRGTVKLKVRKGIEKVAVTYRPQSTFYLSIFFSGICWLIFLFFCAFRNVKFTKIFVSKQINRHF